MPTARLRLVEEPATAPPTAVRRAELPAVLTPLLGRDAIVAEVAARVMVAPLVTLVGAGGIGKTRIALAVAERLAAIAPAAAAVHWIDLTATRSADDVLGVVSAALHIGPQPGHALREAIGVACRARPLLLVLDNCEQVVEAVASLVAALHAAAPGTRVLCTSREPIGVAGEVTWQVPPLAIPSPTRTNGADDAPAVALFLARAREANPALRVDDDAMRAIAGICAALDGVPLAIELAAARCRALAPAQLLGRLDDAMRLLRGGPRTAPARHRTMEEALAWTWDQLGEAEAVCAAAAAVFVGGWSLEAFEAVGQAALDAVPDALPDGTTHDPLDVLTRLVDRSIILVEDGGDGVRYRMLEPVRQFAAARLAAAPWRDAVAATHRAWYAAFAARAASRMEHADHDAWRARVRPDLANVRAAIDWWCDTPGHAVRAAVLLRDVLCVLLDVSDWASNARLAIMVLEALARDGITATTAADDAERRAWVRTAITAQFFDGFALTTEGAVRERLARETIAAARAAGDPILLVLALDVGARTLFGAHPAEAIGFAVELLDRLDAIPSGWQRGAESIAAAAFCWRVQRDLDRGERYAREAERELLACGAHSTLAYARGELAWIALQRGAWAEAARLARAMLAAVGPEPTLVMATALNILASAALGRDDHALAAQLHGAARAVWARCGVVTVDGAEGVALLTSLRAALGAEAADAAIAAAATFPVDAMNALAAGVPEHTAEFPVAFPSERPDIRSADDAVASADVPLLQLRLLGPLQVQRRDAPGVDAVWPYAKPRELVALLGCHPDGCSKDSIGLALWPDLSATQLRNNLHVTLHHARRALGDPSWIVHVGGRYRIATELGVAVDVQRFRQASRRAREAATAEQRHAARAEALGWWGGDFCAGEQFGSWAEDERDRLRAVFLPLLLAHADETLAAGDAAGALETYQRALGEDPFWEAAFRGVVRSLLALGQRGEAQLRLQRFRERVAAEGGGALSAETTRLLAAGAVDASRA